jgi:uncharacterized DUF497 family protein
VDYEFDPEKNAWLLANRGIGFEQIIALIEAGELLQVLEHPNQTKYPGQLLYEVDVDGYVHVVPVTPRGTAFILETIYPSRKATQKHREGRAE